MHNIIEWTIDSEYPKHDNIHVVNITDKKGPVLASVHHLLQPSLVAGVPGDVIYYRARNYANSQVTTTKLIGIIISAIAITPPPHHKPRFFDYTALISVPNGIDLTSD